MDTFILTALDVGQLTHVVVVKDAGGLGGDWHLQMIEVVHTGAEYGPACCRLMRQFKKCFDRRAAPLLICDDIESARFL